MGLSHHRRAPYHTARRAGMSATSVAADRYVAYVDAWYSTVATLALSHLSALSSTALQSLRKCHAERCTDAIHDVRRCEEACPVVQESFNEKVFGLALCTLWRVRCPPCPAPPQAGRLPASLQAQQRVWKASQGTEGGARVGEEVYGVLRGNRAWRAAGAVRSGGSVLRGDVGVEGPRDDAL